MIKLGICTSTETVAGIEDPNFDFLEVHVQNFLRPEKDETAWQDNLQTAKTAVRPVEAANCFLPGSLKCTGPEVDFAAITRYAATAFKRAAETGIEIIVFGSGGARNLPDDFSRDQALDQFVEVLRRIGPDAEKYGVTVVVEPLNRGECNFINSLAEGAAAVRRAAHPKIRLLADFYHMLREDEPAEEIVAHGDLLEHMHLAEKADRTPPGTAGDDFTPFLKAMKQIDYRGRLSMECKWTDPATEAGPAFDALRRQMGEAGF